MKTLRIVLACVVLASSVLSTGCVETTSSGVKLTPIARLAVNGREILDAIEQAQIQIIQMGTIGDVAKEDIAAAMTVFLRVGTVGQQLADLLDVADTTKVLDVRTSAIGKARGLLSLLSQLLSDVVIQVPSLDGRQKIAEALRAVTRMILGLASILNPQLTSVERMSHAIV